MANAVLSPNLSASHHGASGLAKAATVFGVTAASSASQHNSSRPSVRSDFARSVIGASDVTRPAGDRIQAVDGVPDVVADPVRVAGRGRLAEVTDEPVGGHALARTRPEQHARLAA